VLPFLQLSADSAMCAVLLPCVQIGRKQLALAYFTLLGQPVDTALIADIERVRHAYCCDSCLVL
jgi:hypothetical protein